MKTKRILAPFDLTEPERIIGGFLYPNIDAQQVNSFLEMKTGKEWKVGMVVFVGTEISENDVFAKILDSGQKIKSVELLLRNLEDYLHQTNNFKLGDMIGVKPSTDGFELIKLDKSDRGKNKLPQ